MTSGIKSKPVYAPLAADTTGRYHLMLGTHADGRPLAGTALSRVLTELEHADRTGAARTRVLLVRDAMGADAALRAALGTRVGALEEFASVELLLPAFRTVLEHSLMGTRLYVAGPESFIGLAMQIALEFNLNQDEIRAEAMGTLARRVHCVHCRGTLGGVTTNIVRCSGCDRWLLVRDHYSRRLAAYMGVMVDAEAPGELPPLKELYA